MDERLDDEVGLGDAPFDERRALEELERVRQEIRRYQTVREGVNEEFERFVQSFKKSQPPEGVLEHRSAAAEPPLAEPARTAKPSVAVPPRTAPPPPRPAPPQIEDPERIGQPSPVPETPRRPEPARSVEPSRVAEPPKPAAPASHVRPPAPVVAPLPSSIPEPRVPHPIQPASAQFEPLNLEPFIKHVDEGMAPGTPGTSPASAHRVPTSPEDFLDEPQEDDDRDAFAPGADFDALPPPLEPVVETVPSPPPPPAPLASSSRTWIVLGSIVAVVAVGGYAWKLTHSSETTAIEQPSGAATPGAQRAERSGATAASPAPAPAPKPSAAPQAEVVTTQRAWVRVIADGQRVVERELPANSRIPFDARKTIQIRTGNAGAVRLLIRGVDQGSLGRAGEVITRSFPVK